MFNESCVYYLTLLMSVFTDFCPDSSDRYFFGWVYICLLLVFLAVNVTCMIAPTAAFCYRHGRSCILWGLNRMKEYNRKKDLQARLMILEHHQNTKGEAVNILSLKPPAKAKKGEKELFDRLKVVVENHESRLRKKQAKAFLESRKAKMDALRQKFLAAEGKREPKELWKKLDKSNLQDHEKVKLYFEFKAYSALKQQWRHEHASPESMAEAEQKESFDIFLRAFLRKEQKKRPRVADQRTVGKIYAWKTLKQELFKEQEAPSLAGHWVLQELNSYWFFNAQYAESQVQKYVRKNLRMDKKRIKEVHRLLQDEAGPEEKRELFWRRQYLKDISEKDAAGRMTTLYEMACEAIQEKYLKVEQIEQKLDQLYAIFGKQAELTREAEKPAGGETSYPLDEHIWASVRKISAVDLVDQNAR